MIAYRRQLGRSDINVSVLGLGCWAIGGPYQGKGAPLGWGQVDDRESIRAIHAALDHGIDLFDTADMYGCGHSERVLGKALQGRRHKVVVASKFGYGFDESRKEVTGTINLPEEIATALDASLSRLHTDYIDLYQLHVGSCSPDSALEVQARLEELVLTGKIRAYGWSTDDAESVAVFESSRHFVAIQQALNVLQGSEATLAAVEHRALSSLCRSPLAMGLLTDNWQERDALPPDDLRSDWAGSTGVVSRMLHTVAEIRDILMQDDRSLVQGALGWLWARSDVTIPIPGFRNELQVAENASAMRKGPLSPAQMAEIESSFARDFPVNPTGLRKKSVSS